MPIQSYKGLSLLSGTTGSGGTRIMNAFRSLADRTPPVSFTAITDPTATTDINAGYYPGSKIYNTSTRRIWECIDNTAGAAKWVSTSMPVVNVRDFGAKGDGTSDDTAAVQAAINALPAALQATPVFWSTVANPNGMAPTGGVCFLPYGVYKTTAPLSLPAGVVLQGESRSGTAIKSVFTSTIYDLWRGAVEFKGDITYGCRASVFDLSIYADIHCGITYSRSSERAISVFTYNGSTYTDRSSIVNGRFRNGSFNPFTDSVDDYLYVGDTLTWTSVSGRLKTKGTADAESTWIDFTVEYSKGGGVWATLNTGARGAYFYRKQSTFFFGAPGDWAQDTVNGTTRYWIRFKAVGAIQTVPEMYNVRVGTGGTGISGNIERLDISAQNWAIFFGDWCYSQNLKVKDVFSSSGNDGVLWLNGNANWVEEINSEAGQRDPNTFSVDPAMLVLEGAGNTCHNCIIEGVSGPICYYFSGDLFTTSGLWCEISGSPENISIILEDVNGFTTDRFHGRPRIIRSTNVVCDTLGIGFGEDFADTLDIQGQCSLSFNSVNASFDTGSLGDNAISFPAYFPGSNNSGVVQNIHAPVTGNMIPNGDFQNGSYNWNLITPTGGTATMTTENRPDGLGKRLKVAVTANPNRARTEIYATVSLPSHYFNVPGFVGWKYELEGNISYSPYMIDRRSAGGSTALGRAINTRTACRLREIQNGDLIWFLCDPGPKAYLYAFTWASSNGAFTDVANSLDPDQSNAAITMFGAATNKLYLGHFSPVNTVSFDVATGGTGITSGTIEYWNGAAWVAATINSNTTVSGGSWFGQDGTINFTASGWKKNFVNTFYGNRFWIRITPTAMTTSPTLNSVTAEPVANIYLSDVYLVLGENHNYVPTVAAQQRWVNGNVEVQGAASPTTGTWAVGDKVWNTAPTSGGSVGWICTVAGTPGTWKTFGAIS